MIQKKTNAYHLTITGYDSYDASIKDMKALKEKIRYLAEIKGKEKAIKIQMYGGASRVKSEGVKIEMIKTGGRGRPKKVAVAIGNEDISARPHSHAVLIATPGATVKNELHQYLFKKLGEDRVQFKRIRSETYFRTCLNYIDRQVENIISYGAINDVDLKGIDYF